MKRRGNKLPSKRMGSEISAKFVRGFVATGLLSMLQDRFQPGAQVRDRRKILRRALQGGAALAAGSAAADAVRRHEYQTALAAVVGGAVGLIAIDYLLRHRADIDNQENNDEQEKA